MVLINKMNNDDKIIVLICFTARLLSVHDFAFRKLIHFCVITLSNENTQSELFLLLTIV